MIPAPASPRALETLRRENAHKTALLEAIAHDLRGPLSAVLGAALTLERSGCELPADVCNRLATSIVRSARTLERIVNDLLDEDRMSHGTLVLEPREIDVGAVASRVVDDMRADDRVSVLASSSPVRVMLDEVMLAHIIENLVANALRHTTREARVWVSAERTRDGVVVAVEDDGPGVPDDRKASVFESYAKGERSRGTGMGLAIVRHFAGSVGGRAWVDDRPGGGASFKVFLPC